MVVSLAQLAIHARERMRVSVATVHAQICHLLKTSVMRLVSIIAKIREVNMLQIASSEYHQHDLQDSRQVHVYTSIRSWLLLRPTAVERTSDISNPTSLNNI